MGPFSRCLSILVYHRIHDTPDPLYPEELVARDFDRHMRLLKRWFRVLPLSQAVRMLREGTLPVRAACVTFDDGYADNATVALPILRAHGVSATFFVATDFIDGGLMWNDRVIEAVRRAQGDVLDAAAIGLGMLDVSGPAQRRRAIDCLLGHLKYLPAHERALRVEEFCTAVAAAAPERLMMTAQQVAELVANGMEVGAHTMSHPILASIDIKRAGFEIDESRRVLEGITHRPVRLFAYPNGKPSRDYLGEHLALVKNLGFDAAVSTAPGVAHAATDRFQLPRLMPWDRSPFKFLLRLVQNTFRTSPDQVRVNAQ